MRISDWSSDVCSSDLSIHGEVAALNRLHRAMIARLEPGDRLVYLGNLIGRGAGATATVDSLLRFRSLFLARPDAFACDVVHLRGRQELGRASGRERVGQYGEISEVVVSLKKKKQKQ